MSKTKQEKETASNEDFQLLARLNEIGYESSTPEEAVNSMLDLLLAALDCDRAWLLYPCEPDSKTWSIPIERTTPDYPGALALGTQLPMTPELLEMIHANINTSASVTYDPESELQVPDSIRNAFGVQAQISQTLLPSIGQRWIVGLHHCRSRRVWTTTEKRTFELAAKRVCESLNSFIYQQRLEESESKLVAILGNLEDAHLECDQNGTILRASSSTEYHLGYLSKDMIQTAFIRYFHSEIEYEVIWSKLKSQTHIHSSEVNLRSVEGKKTPCLLSAQTHGETVRFSIHKCDAGIDRSEASDSLALHSKTSQNGLHSLLLATQDPQLEELLGPWLGREHISVTTVRQTQKIVDILGSQEFDIVILDKQLTGPHFVATCSFIHNEFPSVPLVTLGVENHAQERIVALDAGADDHISRPIHPEEVAARVRAVWRRHQLAGSAGQDTSRSVERGSLVLDPVGYTAKLDSNELELTTTEFGILLELAKVPGRVLSREQLLDSVWGEDFFGSPRTVDSHMRNLRIKLKACCEGYDPIVSVRGVGYKFNDLLS